MAKLKFWDGSESIGGTKIEYEDDGAHLFLDFGTNFSDEQKFFRYDPDVDNYLWAFEKRFFDLRYLKLLPDMPLENIYWTGKIKTDIDFGKIPEPQIDAILLSHAHYDHQGYIKFLNPKIPLYCHTITSAYYKKMHIERNIRTDVRSNKKSNNEHFRPINEIEHLAEMTFGHSGNVKVKAHLIDHSIPGAMVYLITSSEGKKILWTGDFRTHGVEEEQHLFEKLLTFIEGNKPIDILICEGTNIDEYDIGFEEGGNASVKEFMRAEMEEAGNKGLLTIASVSGNHIYRLDTIYELSKELNKKLCISVYTANMVEKLRACGGFDNDPDCIVHHLKDCLIYERYENEFIQKFEGDQSIPYDVVQWKYFSEGGGAHQPELILILWTGDISYLQEIKPRPRSKFILSSWEPFTEEQQVEHDTLQSWL